MALAVPFLLLVSVLCTQAPAPEPVTDQETELGLAVYDELKAKGEIVESSPLYDSLRPWLCKNSTRYNRTRNFGLYGHAESKKPQKFVFRSALRPNQISFSHGQGPKRHFAAPNNRVAIGVTTDIDRSVH